MIRAEAEKYEVVRSEAVGEGEGLTVSYNSSQKLPVITIRIFIINFCFLLVLLSNYPRLREAEWWRWSEGGSETRRKLMFNCL